MHGPAAFAIAEIQSVRGGPMAYPHRVMPKGFYITGRGQMMLVGRTLPYILRQLNAPLRPKKGVLGSSSQPRRVSLMVNHIFIIKVINLNHLGEEHRISNAYSTCLH